MSSKYSQSDAYTDFIRENNIIAVRNAEELSAFCVFLSRYNPKLLKSLARQNLNDWNYLVHIVEFNGHDSSCIMFEAQYQGEYYGSEITFWGGEQYDDAVRYYKQAPIEMADLM